MIRTVGSKARTSARCLQEQIESIFFGCTYKPEERVDREVLLLAQIIETAWWKVHVATVTADAFGSLADVGLLLLAAILSDMFGVNIPLSSLIVRRRQILSRVR